MNHPATSDVDLGHRGAVSLFSTIGCECLPAALGGRVIKAPSSSPPDKSSAARGALLSLFSGAGGLDLGFHRAGFRTELAIDGMCAAVDTFNANLGPEVAVVGDIAELGTKGVRKLLTKSRVSPVGILGGPPCQGFSRGNVGLDDSEDPRNRLPILYAEIIAELARVHPVQFFVFENVPGLLRARHAHRLAAMREILLPSFVIHELQVDAAHFQVPQHRPRLLWLGLRRETYGTVPWTGPIETLRAPTVRETISGLPEPTFWSRNAAPDPHHANHWTMLPKSARFTTKQFNKWRSFRKLEWDRPSPTVAYGNREIHVHPEGNRRLSIFEAMLLQSFPRNFEIHGNLSEQVTQVSNAVPPKLAEAFALKLARIQDIWEEHGNERIVA